MVAVGGLGEAYRLDGPQWGQLATRFLYLPYLLVLYRKDPFPLSILSNAFSAFTGQEEIWRRVWTLLRVSQVATGNYQKILLLAV